MSHSKFSPSQADRFTHCLASIDHLEANPMPPSKYALAGSNVHSVIEESLKDPNYIFEHADELPEGTLDSVLGFVDVVRAVVTPLSEIKIEENIAHSLQGESVGGTPDVTVWNPTTGELHLFDYKNGYRYVDAENNMQLLQYAFITVEDMVMTPRKIVMHVYQPNRNDAPHKMWETTVDRVKEYETTLDQTITNYNMGMATHTPGPWCEYCNKAECPAISKEIEVVKTSTAILNRKTSKDLVRFLEYKKQVVGAFKDAEAILLDRMVNKKEKVAGFKVVTAIGNRKWTDKATPAVLSKTLGIPVNQLMQEPSLKSPAQVEKVIKTAFKGAGKVDVTIKDFVERPERGPKIVKTSEEGKPFDGDKFENDLLLD
jgi:hypothetical protein